MALPNRTRKFSDLDLNFTAHPVTGDVSMLTGDLAVVRSVRNLIFLAYYEKPFHPEIASGVRQFLFELPTPLTAQRLKFAVENVIKNFEPRVSLIDVVVQSMPDNLRIQVSVMFYITGQAKPTTLDVFLQRVR